MRYRFGHLHDDVMRLMSCLSHRLGRNIEQYNEPYPGIQGCNCILPIKLITVTLKMAKLLCISYDLRDKIQLNLLLYNNPSHEKVACTSQDSFKDMQKIVTHYIF